MRLHERLYRFKVSEMEYTLLIKGLTKCYIDNVGGTYEIGDLVRFDSDNAFTENLFRITWIRRIPPANESHYVLSLERVK